MPQTSITWQSTPDYDEWGFDSYWSCDQWRQWYDALKSKYGQVQAKNIWVDAWGKQSWDEHNYSWCKYDTAFATYMRSQGIDVGHVLSNVLNSGVTVIDNVSQGAVGLSEILKNIAPYLIVGGAIYLLLPYFKDKLYKK